MSTIPSGYKKLSVIGISYKGDYNVANTYSKLNAVYYDGSTYIALIDNPVGAPTNDNVNWKYMAQGFLSSQLSSLSAVDIEGLLGVVGASVNAQTLVNKLAELIDSKENKITKNTAFNKNFETNSSVLKANGTASVGTSTNIARADHVHPSDSTKLSANGNASNTTVAFTSSDKLTDLEYIDVDVVATGETQSSLMAKLSQISQNVRYIKENGTSQGSTIVVTFKDDELIGKTCKITSSTFEYTQTVNSEKKAVFEVAELGTLTATCECLTKELIIYNKGNYTIAFDSFVEMLVSKSGVTNTYTSVANLLENQLDTRRVMTVHASADFLVSLMTTFTTVRDTVIDSTYGLKWIGLRDYICDKLMAVSSIKTAMLESDNWEYILKDHVPIMTSNTAPYGEIIFNYENSDAPAVRVFNGGNSWWFSENNKYANSYVGYKFVNPICVKRIYVTLTGSTDTRYNYNTKCVFEGSNNKSDWDNLGTYDFAYSTSKQIKHEKINNNNYYLYYRLRFTDANFKSSSENYAIVGGLQFYGRSLNVSVPTMTSNTEPYGEVFASTIYSSSYPAYLAFDKTESTTSRWASTYAESYDTRALGYKFNKDIKVNFVKLNTWVHTSSMGKSIKEFKIQGSNDGSTWTDIYNGITTNKINSTTGYVDGTDMYTFSNDNTYKMYRIRPLSTWADVNVGDSYSESTINELNFYGVDYSEREYAPNSTMKYIYDHGVELETLEAIVESSENEAKKLDEQLYLKRGTNGSGGAIYVTSNTVALNLYSRFFINIGDQLYSSYYYNGLANQINLGVAEAKNSNIVANKWFTLPCNELTSELDISSVNGNNYLRVYVGQSTGAIERTATINEWWLE